MISLIRKGRVKSVQKKFDQYMPTDIQCSKNHIPIISHIT